MSLLAIYQQNLQTTIAGGGGSSGLEIVHWNLPTVDSVVNNATIAPGATLIGDLKLSDNVYSTECRVAITPATDGAVAAQILFAPLGDIDGVYTVNTTTIQPRDFPGARQAISAPLNQPLTAGTVYRNIYSVKGRDFSAFRACLYNMSPVPITATVTYKASTSKTA